MSLQSWANSGWLRTRLTSAQEIKDLLAIVDRDLADAHGDISADWRFGIAYNWTPAAESFLVPPVAGWAPSW